VSRRVPISALKLLGFLLAGASLAITCACTPQGNVREQPAPPPDPLAAADRLLAQGSYAAAGAAYAAQAGSGDATRAQRLAALAALAFQDAGDDARADTLAPDVGDAPAADATVALAQARARLRAGDAAEAHVLATGIDVAPLSPYLRGVQARTAGLAALALGRHAEAAELLLAALNLPYPPTQEPALVTAAWDALARLPVPQLESRLATSDPRTGGWYALALIQARAGFDHASLVQQTDAWRAQYPGHPASAVIDGLRERALTASTRPRKVALILPFDAALGGAARAVRDGFMVAWYLDGDAAARPAVAVYATSDKDIVQDYERAVAAGAGLVIGPLQKEPVERLRRHGTLTVPLLALNTVDPASAAIPAPAGFYQFGLTPENEAEQVARRAYHPAARALILAPNTAWGTRLQNAYAAAWEQLGGTVLARVSYGEVSAAYADAVRRALNIDLSEARAAALGRRLGVTVHSEPRRRADVDVILLAAFPDNARQLLPQLRYFGADALPVFATSHVYAGTPDPERDIDLNGLTFGDMPWLHGAADRASFELIRRQWPAQMQNFGRLYAFGIDSYRVLPYLNRMRHNQGMRVPGVTGDLAMDPGGVIHRHMTWLRFVDGVPGLLGASGSPGSD
jgi:outer membrane PBP1 activator LpoA protein